MGQEESLSAGNWRELIRNRLTREEQSAISAVQNYFPFKITRDYARLIDWDNPADPLRMQVVPSQMELQVNAGESRDPLDERRYMPIPGVIHKYRNRILWLITCHCALHCRFCFRRWHRCAQEVTVDSTNQTPLKAIEEYLQQDPEIIEVVLSGGDPLTLPREELNSYLRRLASIRSVRLIRIHTRIPVVAGESELTNKPLFQSDHSTLRLVVHVNHPNEISPGFKNAILRWRKLGIPVLSQSVLLAHINDTSDILTRLFLELACLRIQPYYLHLLDPAEGTRQFHVPVEHARRLISTLRETLPGYAVPRLVVDLPGRPSKTIIEFSS
ncbi:KamA family radical SAM protein [bacterium]|nr:KamA family radical SAM protein [candidate division CSSED10-310 bacterium]